MGIGQSESSTLLRARSAADLATNKFLDRRALLKAGAALGSAMGLAFQPNLMGSSARFSPVKGPGRLRKVREFDIFRDPGYYFGPGPSPVVFPDGEIVMLCRRHPAAARSHGYMGAENCWMASKDGGISWSAPEPFDYGGVGNPNLTLLRNGTLLYATRIWEAVTKEAYERAKEHPQERVAGGAGRYRLSRSAEDSGNYALASGVSIRNSHDRGRTWSPRYSVSPIPQVPSLVPGWPAPANLRSPVVELRDGQLVLPVYSYPNPWRVVLMGSKDVGKSWSFLGEIAGPSDLLELPPGALVDGAIAYNETFVHETPSGKLVAFIRIHAGQTERQQAEWHETSNPAGRLVTATSYDGGRTWLDPLRHRLWGFPYWAISMPSGRVLLAYGYRQEPYGVRARLLDPECEHIDDAEEIVVRDDGETRDLGYPQGALMTDGRALLTFYFNSKKEEGREVYLAAAILEEI